MNEILTIVALAAGAFVGTNLDNLILLVAFLSRYRLHNRAVIAGYISGMVLIGLLCLLIAKVGDVIPVQYLGLLGVIPILIGIKALFQLFLPEQTRQAGNFVSGQNISAIFTSVLVTQFANGADSIITFSLLLADSKTSLDVPIFLTFLTMSVVFAGLAFFLVSHRKVGEVLNRLGHYLTPFILIFVGIYILSNTATDLMVG